MIYQSADGVHFEQREIRAFEALDGYMKRWEKPARAWAPWALQRPALLLGRHGDIPIGNQAWKMKSIRRSISNNLLLPWLLAFAGFAHGGEGAGAMAGRALQTNPAPLAGDNPAATGHDVVPLKAREDIAQTTGGDSKGGDCFPTARNELSQAAPPGHAPVERPRATTHTRPNILFILTDDQRADTIAALGNPVIKTPNLDRLCQRGLAFTRAYMQGGFNGATCVPSRAMLLSGRPLFHVDETLMSDETWPAAFGCSGYTTFATGKWHNGRKSLAASFQSARAIFDGGMADPLHAPLSNLENGALSKPEIAQKHACEAFADEAVRFLQQPKAGPFLCYVAFDGPHDPHIVPQDFPVRYEPDARLLPPNFLAQHPFDNGDMTVRDEMLLPHPRTPDGVQRMTAEYYRYISFLDLQIGRILDALAASPAAANTLVVFSADSGVARGSHGLIGKQNLYEHSIHVPLIIAGPGIPAHQRTAAMCYLFDVMPTLAALCGVTGPKSSEGMDLRETLRDPNHAARTELVFGYRNIQRAIRDDRWKLIRYPQVDRMQLFDLEIDPQEQNNLAGNHNFSGTVAGLTKRLEATLAQYGDKCPLTTADPKPDAWSPPAKASPTTRSKAAK
jgi:arylsulfatase A-like enzyme